ncbi:MAG: tetratricopeptide repeat protein, partial [Anaerolineales bacterium]|nr:tetratricopeptide repeat protein [Anaerolineales bacterium]
MDYEMLPGQGKGGKARELVAYLDRRNRLTELVENLRHLRPDIRDADLFGSDVQLPHAEQFEAIIWVSAKRTTLTGEGISKRHQHISTLTDIYRAIAIALEREDLIRSQPETQAELIRQALIRQRTLLIIDNLETIDDVVVNSFIKELPIPTKAIITTRHRISMASPIRLVGMPWADAQRLIEHESAKKGVSLSTTEVNRLYKRTGGVPLAIVWSIAQMGFGYGIENVLTRLGNATNDVARFCFEGTVEQLRGHPAHQLLMACAIFTNDVSRKGLEQATHLPILDQEDGLVQLERLSLINKKGNRFSLMPLTRTFALAEMVNYHESEKQIRQNWLAYLAELCQEPIGEYFWRYRDHAFYEEGELVLESLDWAYDYGNIDVIFLLSRAAYDYLEVIGDWNSILTYVDRALTLAESISDRFVDRARFANTLGWVNYQQGNYDKAQRWYDIAFDNYKQAENKVGVAITWQHRSSIARKLKDFKKAKSLNDQAWQIATDLNDGDLQALIETNYGKLARDMGNWILAWEHFDNVRKYFEERVSESPRDEPLARSTWGHLAIVAVHLGQPE